MLALSLIPSGLYQFSASLEHGTWFARSAVVVQSPFMRIATWLRMPGDILFTIGALCMGIFTAKSVWGAWAWSRPVTEPEMDEAALSVAQAREGN